MCMSNSVRIESKDVPKYAYKVYNGLSKNLLKTYFRNVIHFKDRFNKSDVPKKSTKTIMQYESLLHSGRISVYVYKKDAIDFCKRAIVNNCTNSTQAWKVEIKQTTKYAYKGKFSGETLAVDQVKPIKKVL